MSQADQDYYGACQASLIADGEKAFVHSLVKNSIWMEVSVMKEINAAKTYFDNSVNVMYGSENSICDGLKKMMDQATNPQLKEAFRLHLEEAQEQIRRLEAVAQKLEIELTNKPSEGLLERGIEKSKKLLKGLVEWNFNDSTQAAEVIIDHGIKFAGHFSDDTKVCDLALVDLCKQIVHLEIGRYEVLLILAERAGLIDEVMLLQRSLDEVLRTNESLSNLLRHVLLA